MLVVIDMQPSFGSQVSKALPGVLAAIKTARRNRETVVVVEYVGQGRTHKKINDLLKGYANVVRIFKDIDNAAPAMEEAGLLRWKDRAKYKLVGVNTCYCVRRTAQGLADLECPNLTHIPGAVSCMHDTGERNCWPSHQEELEALCTCPAPAIPGVANV